MKELQKVVSKTFPREDDGTDKYWTTSESERHDSHFWYDYIEKNLIDFQISFGNYLAQYASFRLQHPDKNKQFFMEESKDEKWIPRGLYDIYTQYAQAFTEFFLDHPEKLDVFFRVTEYATINPGRIQRFKEKFQPFFELANRPAASPATTEITQQKGTQLFFNFKE